MSIQVGQPVLRLTLSNLDEFRLFKMGLAAKEILRIDIGSLDTKLSGTYGWPESGRTRSRHIQVTRSKAQATPYSKPSANSANPEQKVFQRSRAAA